MKNCPVCNELLGDNAERCIKCKYDFTMGEYLCSHCNKPLINSKSICECGGWAVTPTKKQEEVPSMVFWTREELKNKAKSRLYSMLKLAIIVCLLLSISEKIKFQLETPRVYYTLSDSDVTGDDISNNLVKHYLNTKTGQYEIVSNTQDLPTKLSLQIGWKRFTLLATSNFSFLKDLILYSFLFLILWTIFILDPYIVGVNRFFMENIYSKASLKSVLFSFRNGSYFSVVWKMFLVEIKTFLWFLLLIIPGIVKSYEYIMIPYILSENPDIDTLDAFMISKKMMIGNKWNVFVLDLSFILWEFLSIATLGIAGIVWVVPYRCATRAELYHRYRTAYLYYNYEGADQLIGYEK